MNGENIKLLIISIIAIICIIIAICVYHYFTPEHLQKRRYNITAVAGIILCSLIISFSVDKQAINAIYIYCIAVCAITITIRYFISGFTTLRIISNVLRQTSCIMIITTFVINTVLPYIIAYTVYK